MSYIFDHRARLIRCHLCLPYEKFVRLVTRQKCLEHVVVHAFWSLLFIIEKNPVIRCIRFPFPDVVSTPFSAALNEAIVIFHTPPAIIPIVISIIKIYLSVQLTTT